MPTGSSSQVAITAQATILIDFLHIPNTRDIVVKLTANVIKNVYFRKDQDTVDTGIPLDYIANDHMVIVKPLTPANPELYTFSSTKHDDGENATYTLVITRLSGIDTALDAEVEIADVVVATGSIIGNSTGFLLEVQKPVIQYAFMLYVIGLMNMVLIKILKVSRWLQKIIMI